MNCLFNDETIYSKYLITRLNHNELIFRFVERNESKERRKRMKEKRNELDHNDKINSDNQDDYDQHYS